MTTPTISPWFARLQAGDATAFDAIYQQESPVVYGYLLGMTRNRDASADLFQNVWLKLAAHASRLAPDTRIRAWLLTVSHNEVRSYQRAKRWDLSRVLLFTRATPELAHTTTPDLALDLHRALARLDPTDREVLMLETVADLDSADICRITNLTPEAWRKRLSRARARLDAQLNLTTPFTLEQESS